MASTRIGSLKRYDGTRSNPFNGSIASSFDGFLDEDGSIGEVDGSVGYGIGSFALEAFRQATTSTDVEGRGGPKHTMPPGAARFQAQWWAVALNLAEVWRDLPSVNP